MRIKVDAEKCQGHNRCFSLAVELFDVDDYGYATEIGDGEVPSDLEDKARLAVANCPESLFLLRNSGTGQLVAKISHRFASSPRIAFQGKQNVNQIVISNPFQFANR